MEHERERPRFYRAPTLEERLATVRLWPDPPAAPEDAPGAREMDVAWKEFSKALQQAGVVGQFTALGIFTQDELTDFARGAFGRAARAFRRDWQRPFCDYARAFVLDCLEEYTLIQLCHTGWQTNANDAAIGEMRSALLLLVERHTAQIRGWARTVHLRHVDHPSQSGATAPHSTDQEEIGWEAFFKAVRDFKFGQGSLWTYAQGKLQDAKGRAQRDDRDMSEEARKHEKPIRVAYERLMEPMLGIARREPTDAEICAEVNLGRTEPLPLSTVESAMRAIRRLDVPLNSEIHEGSQIVTAPDVKGMDRDQAPMNDEQRKVLVIDMLWDGFGYGWPLVVALLRQRPQPLDRSEEQIIEERRRNTLAPALRVLLDWDEMREEEYSAFMADIPPSWPKAWEFMQPPPPTLTESALQQHYNRNRASLGAFVA